MAYPSRRNMSGICLDAEIVVPKDHDPAKAAEATFSGKLRGMSENRKLGTDLSGATTLRKSADNVRPYHGQTIKICGVYTRKDIKAIVPITL